MLRGLLRLVTSLALLGAAAPFTPAASGRASLVARLSAPSGRTPAAARMGLMDFLSSLLYEKREGESGGAGSAALSRLKVVLATDRTGLDELTMANIRTEIQQVISKYVVIEEDEVNFDLMFDDKITLVTATFPLRGARAKNEAPGTPTFETPAFSAPPGVPTGISDRIAQSGTDVSI